MMTRIKTLMIWIGLLLSLASCKDSLEAITLGGDELPTEGVTLSIQLPNFTPQEISTRAGDETTESINSLWLVCYDTSDKYLDMQDCTKAYAAATADADGYKKIKTNLPKGTETIHLVANVPGLTPEQAEKLDAMKDITPDLSKPICWGAKTLSDLMNDSKISLTRQCAKVTVKTSVSNFEITDLHVWHSASKGSIAPAGYKVSTKDDDLATSTELNSKYIAGGSAAVVAVNETSAGKADIIIKAKYKGTEGTEGTEGFYKVALYTDDTKTAQYALVRNHNYIVTVISVNGAGYATEEEALKADPENRLTVTVVDDNPKIVDMIACKDYELGVCGTQTVAATNGKDPIIVPITLVTNLKEDDAKDGKLYKVEISNDAKSWITECTENSKSTTTPTSPDESAPKGTKFVLNLTLTANNKSEEPREGTITITSGDLKRTILIHQEGYDFKRADDRQVVMNYNGTIHDNYFAWLDSEMHGVKPSENKVDNQEKTRNQGLHFSVGDNKIYYLIPKKPGDQFVKKSDKISYSDEVYKGNNYYKVTLDNSTNNYDLWTDKEGFVIENTEDAAHPITITYPIYHTGVFSEITESAANEHQLGEPKKGWFYYEVVKVNVTEPSEDGTSSTDKTYYMLDRNLGASNSDFYSPGSANIANDKSSIGGYFKISNDKNSNAYIDKYVIGNFRVPKGNELEAIANKASVDLLETSTGEPYNCIRIPTSSSQKNYIYIPISGYYESNSFKDEFHANLWSKSLLSGYQGFSTDSNEYGFWYLYLDIYNKIKTITNTRFVQGYDGSNTGRYKAMPIRLIYVP
ncbi:BACON domain-containing protein [Segatella copri]|uniref:BACON domain-containing protein n=1 Tax=Segatella copri TaxID=165179 RepID=UPI00294AFE77|nr:BACON domain-containing carbohydrate-binding protein [Segatella copri]